MTRVWTVIVKETRLLLRDPAGLVMLFVLPAVFILVLSVALQGVFSTEISETLDIVIVNRDRGDVGNKIIEGFEKAGHFRVITEMDGRSATLEAAQEALRKKKHKIVLYIPPESSDAADFSGEGTLGLFVDPTLSNEMVAHLESELKNFACLTTLDKTGGKVDDLKENIDKLREAARKLKEANDELRGANDELVEANEELIDANEKLLQVLEKVKRAMEKVKQLQALAKSEGMELPSGYDMSAMKGLQPDKADLQSIKKAEKAKKSVPTEPMEEVDIPDEIEVTADKVEANRLKLDINRTYYSTGEIKAVPNSVQQNVPGWTLFALFWICQLLAISLIGERQTGVYRRLLVSPISSSEFFIGKIVPFFILNMVQAVVMFSIGVYVLPLLGAPPLEIREIGGLVLITVTFSLVSISFGFLMAAFSKTLILASILTATFSIIMAAVGGVMVPRFIMPDYLQTLSLFVPHGWALEGYLDLLVRNHTAQQILPHAGMLCLFALVFYITALIRLKRGEAHL